jgi:hypothetical protein
MFLLDVQEPLLDQPSKAPHNCSLEHVLSLHLDPDLQEPVGFLCLPVRLKSTQSFPHQLLLGYMLRGELLSVDNPLLEYELAERSKTDSFLFLIEDGLKTLNFGSLGSFLLSLPPHTDENSP